MAQFLVPDLEKEIKGLGCTGWASLKYFNMQVVGTPLGNILAFQCQNGRYDLSPPQYSTETIVPGFYGAELNPDRASGRRRIEVSRVVKEKQMDVVEILKKAGYVEPIVFFS